MFKLLHTLVVISCYFFVSSAWTQGGSDFYSGRTVTILVGSGSGGLTDTSARLIAQFLEKHIPGEPTVIVQNMPGGGSVTMANHVTRSVPRDGTVIGYPVPGMITAELLEPNRAKYQGRALNWIGSAFRTTNTISVLSRTGVKNLEDARQKPLFLGASGRGSPLYQIPALAKGLLGLNFTIITGYDGGSEVVLAMERGEVDGQAIALDFWAGQRPAWLLNGSLTHLLRIGPLDPVRAPDVPHLRDLVSGDRDKALVELFEIGFTLGWPLFAPPGVPDERVFILREAFSKVVEDPDFSEIIETTLHIELDPIMGPELANYVDQALSTPQPLVDDMIKILGL